MLRSTGIVISRLLIHAAWAMVTFFVPLVVSGAVYDGRVRFGEFISPAFLYFFS